MPSSEQAEAEAEASAADDTPRGPTFMVVHSCRDMDASTVYGSEFEASGTVAVVQQYDTEYPVRFMTFGRTVIGAQYVDDSLRGM